MVGKFCRLSLIGPLVGYVFGVLLEFMLTFIHNNYVLETNLSIVAVYLCWYLAENTALHVSGILAIVVLGVYMSEFGKTAISAESEHALHHIWGYVGFVAETLIFMLAGIIIGVSSIRLEDDPNFNVGSETGSAFGNYLMAHVIRFSMICLFWPILNKLGYGMSFR